MIIGTIIQARMGSTRLPGKVLKEIEGKPMLWHIVYRLTMSTLIKKIIVATSTHTKDDAIAKFCKQERIPYFRGSEDDCLERYYQAAKENMLDVITRITADCPLIDPVVTDRVISAYFNESGGDCASNVIKRTYPRGLDTEVFSFSCLQRVYKAAKTAREREHVTIFMHEHPERFRLISVENDVDLSGMRWTVDEEADLRFVKEIYKRLSARGNFFLTNDVLKILELEPEIKQINKEVEQKNK